jgi:alkylation response protein AidB-like acyl-CoA dehydrogenase
MDLSWSEQQVSLRNQVICFSKKNLNQDLIDLDDQQVFNWEGWRRCGTFGIPGLFIPKQYGGRGQDILTTIYALEGLGYGCKDNGLIFAIHAHTWACELPLLTFGSEAQKQRYLPKLCRGEWIGGHAISEPEAGSDIYSMQTTAQRQDSKYILNGHKMFVSNGSVADVIVVFANVDLSKRERGITAFLVEKGTPGLLVKRQVSNMGLRTAMTSELTFEHCEIPIDNRLGQEGAGLPLFSHSMEWERGFILASAVGTMERLLEQCIKYARQRKQFGQPIGKFQLVADKIVEMQMRIETARALLYKVAWLKHMGKSAFMEAAMTKLYISDAWSQSCLDAIQLHGGYGYLTELELEREARDALGSKLYSGTSEIQRTIISQFLGL